MPLLMRNQETEHIPGFQLNKPADGNGRFDTTNIHRFCLFQQIEQAMLMLKECFNYRS